MAGFAKNLIACQVSYNFYPLLNLNVLILISKPHLKSESSKSKSEYPQETNHHLPLKGI